MIDSSTRDDRNHAAPSADGIVVVRTVLCRMRAAGPPLKGAGRPARRPLERHSWAATLGGQGRVLGAVAD